MDGMALPAWLVALPLYEKVGFEVDRDFEFDMTPYGSEGLTKHILMIRLPVKSARATALIERHLLYLLVLWFRESIFGKVKLLDILRSLSL